MVYKNNFITFADLWGVGGGDSDLWKIEIYFVKGIVPLPWKTKLSLDFFFFTLIISVRLGIKYNPKTKTKFYSMFTRKYTCITLEIKKEKKKESQGNKMWTNEHWQFFSLGFSLLISEKKSSHVFLYAKYCGHRYAPDVASK